MDGNSPACVDMLADDGAGGAAAPNVPGGAVAPRGPGGVPRGTAPSGSGVPSTGPKILLSEVVRSSGGMPWESKFGSGGKGREHAGDRDRYERLVAVADFDGGRALPGVSHAGIVAGAANRER